MEELNSVWQIGIIALLLGALIGILAYRLLAPSVRDSDKIRSDLEAARDELERYRASVNQHFDKTSALVNDLTQNYVKVYQHLAEGAQTLGDGKTFSNRLEHHPGKVSIALEDPRETPREIDADAVVDVAPAPAGTLDEHAAPYSDAAPADETTDAGDAAAPSGKPDTGSETARDEPAKPDVETRGEPGTREPVLNVEALDGARESPEEPIPGGAGDDRKTAEAVPDPGTTRH